MTPAGSIALALALAAAPGDAAPARPALASVERAWRVEIAGQHVGWARLTVRCAGGECDVEWVSVLRPPETDGALRRRLVSRTTVDGRALRVRAEREGEPPLEAGAGPLPASLAELVLSHAREGERRCVDVRDEGSGESGTACATRRGDWLEAEVLGVALRFRAAPGAAAEEVEIPAQRARFVADARPQLPARAPRLLESEVALGPGLVADGSMVGARVRFCGREPEPAPPHNAVTGLVTRTLGVEWPEGASCREKTQRWVERVAARNVGARHVVGVAWDGEGFVWHEWAEAFVEGHWIAVDPSFRQLPAAGTRFAIARFHDGPTRQEAGRAILPCWGRNVERASE